MDWRITSQYGWRRHPVTGEPRLHAGVDFGLPQGTPVPAMAAGRVHRVLPVAPDRTAVVEVDSGPGMLGNLIRRLTL